MRIAHVGPALLPIGYELGGAVERRVLELARHQALEGHDVLVVSLAPTADQERLRRLPNELAGLEVVDIACRSSRPQRDIEFLLRARRSLGRFGPDVIHVHNAWAAGTCLQGLKAPRVLSFDYFQYPGSGQFPLRPMYLGSIKAFDRLLPVSDYCLGEAKRWWRLPSSRFTILPNGVNVEQFSPDACGRESKRSALGVADRFVLGYVGRVCEQKGSDVLVAAYRRLAREHPSVSLVVAGPAGQFGTHGSTPLTTSITDAGGLWLGAVPDGDLADVFRALDVFVMPTREYEMFGMAAAEALATGTPVVCSRQGGLPEVVSSGAGILVPPGDPVALAGAISSLLESAERMQQLTAQARPSVQRYAWSAIADRALRIYRDVAR